MYKLQNEVYYFEIAIIKCKVGRQEINISLTQFTEANTNAGL